MDQEVACIANIFHFDEVFVDGENFRVQKNGQNVPLTPRAFDVLIFLLKNRGRTVEKQELFDHIWKNVYVSDNALTKVIKEIRHSLGDPIDAPRYIETVPKRGYRFIGELKEGSEQVVQEAEENSVKEDAPDKDHFNEKSHATLQLLWPSGLPGYLTLSIAGALCVLILIGWMMFRQNPVASLSSPIRSIAVLPFKPLDENSRNESLEMGMAETLITRLSNLKQVTVRPISAVIKYTGQHQDPIAAGRETQAEAVLDGSIQKAGERVRVTVRLVDVRSGIQLWSEKFDENFTDIFKVQDSIAEKVTNALTLQLSKQEKEQLTKHFTDNPEAYQLYLQGQFLWNRRRQNWIDQSLCAYQNALEKDPNFALAHIGVADAYIMMSGHRRISMQEAEEKARPAIMKALELDNSLAQAHNALAELKYQYEYDWPGGEREFKTAIQLNPNVAWIHQAYGWFLMSAARFDEASAEMEKARALDPSSMTLKVAGGRLLYYSRRYDEALRLYENILAAEPDDNAPYFTLFHIYEQKQMYPEALEAFIKAFPMSPEKEERLREAFRTGGWPGFLRKKLEEVNNKALKAGREPLTSNADTYARLGDKDKAFYWLEKVFDARDPSILQFKVEPIYDKLRDDPRYDRLVRRMGLQP